MRQPLNNFYEVLKRVFGHSEFRGKQKEVVEAAIAGRDVFVLAPTGMGKSLCFQLPAVTAEKGVTLVISPLCALMTDQVERLRKKGIPVVAWNSETDLEERQRFEKDILSESPRTRLLYISPERYATFDCTRLLDCIYKKRRLNRLVVDEAHCISEWGHSFRSEYRGLGKFRERYTDVPIMALTATATPVVQRDIVYSLKMDQDDIFYAAHPFNRENLFYEVRYMSLSDWQTRKQQVFEYITLLYQRRNRPSSGIIYCRAKATCDDVSDFLQRHGLSAQPYHSGIDKERRKQTLHKWAAGGNGDEGSIDVVVATIAFGLGIDKEDVRYVIHYDLPMSFEGYYQETGRAGRDGQPSKCILYYSREDAFGIRERMVVSNPNRVNDGFQGPSPTQRAKSSIDELIEYAEKVAACRHAGICRYFGEDVDESIPGKVESLCNSMCDVCKYPEKTKKRKAALTPRDEVQTFRRQRQHSRQKSSETPPESNMPARFPVNRSGESKRRIDATDLHGPLPSTKKVKTGYISTLQTLPFQSINRLKKPFKSPLLTKNVNHQSLSSVSVTLSETGSSDSTTKPRLEPALDGDIEIGNNISEFTDTNLDAGTSKIDDWQRELDSVSDAQLEAQHYATDVELENTASAKLPLSHRMRGFAMLRRSMCSLKFEVLPGLDQIDPNMGVRLVQFHATTPEQALNYASRDKILQDSAREAEFAALSLSSTSNGYNMQIKRTVRAISHLAKIEQGQDQDVLDDAQDLMEIIQRHGKFGRGK